MSPALWFLFRHHVLCFVYVCCLPVFVLRCYCGVMVPQCQLCLICPWLKLLCVYVLVFFSICVCMSFVHNSQTRLSSLLALTWEDTLKFGFWVIRGDPLDGPLIPFFSACMQAIMCTVKRSIEDLSRLFSHVLLIEHVLWSYAHIPCFNVPIRVHSCNFCGGDSCIRAANCLLKTSCGIPATTVASTMDTSKVFGGCFPTWYASYSTSRKMPFLAGTVASLAISTGQNWRTKMHLY